MERNNKPTDVNITELMNDHELFNEEMMKDTVFVFDQGWNQLISECSKIGANIVLPNLEMSHALLGQTLIRQGKSILATSEILWSQIKESVQKNEYLNRHLKVLVFDEKEDILNAIAC